MRRTACAALAVTTLVAGLSSFAVGGPAAGAAAAAEDPYGTVFNILPPGSNGTVTSPDLFGVGPDMVADESNPPNFADQLEMYDALTEVEPGAITREDIERLYKSASLTPAEVISTETPRDGVTIERDAYGVPFITGETFEDTEFGAGYAATQDRMFLMDALRHSGRARLAEFAGDTPGNVAMDQAQLRSAYYTEEEATEQIAKAAERAGDGGPQLLAGVDAFLEGINAAQETMCPGGLVVAESCPVEYAALQQTPTDWTRADIVYLASLVGGIFGKGGGHEYDNALWLQRLIGKFGLEKGKQVYNDLREKNDPEAPTTSEIYTPYQLGGVKPGKPGVALPDIDGPTAPGSGAPTGDSAAPPSTGAARMDLPGYSIEVPLESHGMSNAILVTAEKSATGNPLAVMGPQTSYFTPQLLTEQVLNGPGIQARGVAFAGTNLFVQLGRGVDYAWSATSAGSDNIDTVVERLCNTDGSEPTVESTGYLLDAGSFGGTRGRSPRECVEMEQFTHSETTTPSGGSQNPPKTYEFQVLRTSHGLVQLRTTVSGDPVAIVSQRSTYGHEVDSVIGFSQLNDPGFVNEADSFQQAASNIDYTFNWFYADSEDISYYSSGLLPIRPKSVDGDLPRWGDDEFDWKGWLSFERHPRQTNPERGYLVSWNNKQAPGFAASDAEWAYGSVYRSLALEKRLKATLAGGQKVDLEQMVGVMSRAATADSRAAYTLPLLLKVIGKDKKTADARAVLKAWVKDGAPRVDRDRDGAYAHQQAIAIFDHWWQHDTNKSVVYTAMEGGLGARLVRKVPVILDDHPRHGMGSAWNGVPWYGWLNKDLRSLLGKKVEAPYSTAYCGKGELAKCRTALRASLLFTVEQVLAEQNAAKVEELEYDKSQDDIRHSTAGVVGVRPIDWQNRPTFQQVVEFTSHR